MTRLLPLVIFVWTSIVFAANCTRGINPFQDSKDRINTVHDQLAGAAGAVRKDQKEQAKKLLKLASENTLLVKHDLEAKQRALPQALGTAIFDLSKHLDATAIETVAKQVNAFSMSMTCPLVKEPLSTNLLPPDPTPGKQWGTMDYRVFAYTHNHETQLVREFLAIPLGDCLECKRGISLNCAKPGCETGLANGVGMRVLSEGKRFIVVIKNGTHYRLQSRNELPLTPGQKIDVSFLSEGENLTYRVEFLFISL